MADLRDLAIKTAEDVNEHAALIAGKADVQHVHTAEDITAGTLAAARLPAASTSARGGVQLATTAETTTGINAAKAVTPAALASALSPMEAAIAALQSSQGGASTIRVYTGGTVFSTLSTAQSEGAAQIPVPFTNNYFVATSPDINPSSTLTISTAVGISAGSPNFRIRARTVSGSATNRTIHWMVVLLGD